MVLESVVNPKKVRQKPFLMFWDSLLLSSIALWISFLVFPESSSVLNIAFIVIASMPVIHRIFVLEEKEYSQLKGNLISRHSDVIAVYAWFFVGLVISYSFWYVALPSEPFSFCLSEKTCLEIPDKSLAFKEQEKTLSGIVSLNKSVSGQATAPGAELVPKKGFWEYFNLILSNNLLVLLLAILFSFVYGAGALFLISWNASVIAVKIGQGTLPLIAQYSYLGPLAPVTAYMHGLFNALGFLPHGIFELPGFFVGAIAGGIISIALTKKKYAPHEFQAVAKDAFALVFLAIILVFLGALIEAYLISLS